LTTRRRCRTARAGTAIWPVLGYPHPLSANHNATITTTNATTIHSHVRPERRFALGFDASADAHEWCPLQPDFVIVRCA